MSLISMSLLSAPFISALPNFIANFAATLMIMALGTHIIMESLH